MTVSAPVPLGGPLILWENAFTPEQLDAIERVGDALPREKAALEGDNVDPDAKRRTQIGWIVRNRETEWLYARLEEIVLRLNTQYYKYDLYGLMERLQYTVYHGAQSGHYDWHVDHGVIAPAPRKISLSVQLTAPDQYEGCDLELSPGDRVHAAPRMRGAVIAFSSYVLHRVTPILSGTRKSLVVWASGPEYR